MARYAGRRSQESIVKFALTRFHERNKFRHVRRRTEDERTVPAPQPDIDDRYEAFDRIIRQIAERTHVGGKGIAGHKHCVTIRRRTRHKLGADVAGRARFVIDHHLSSASSAFSNQARNDIGPVPGV
jgi:hypothetical protein